MNTKRPEGPSQYLLMGVRRVHNGLDSEYARPRVTEQSRMANGKIRV